jgi:hypothetical protein
MMAVVWRYTHRVIPGPLGMLLLHNLVFWTGLALLVLACRLGPLASVACVLGIGFFPPVFALLGALWKDVGMGAALTLATGLILAGMTRASVPLVALAVVPLFYATSVRSNALPAVVPLVGWGCAAALRAAGRPSPTLVTLVAGTLVGSAGFLGSSVAADRALAASRGDAVPSAVQYSMVHDLAGVAVRTGELRLPAYLRRVRPEITLDALRETYDPADTNRLIYAVRWPPDTFYTATRSDVRELARCWIGAIAARPWAYVRHRAGVLATLFQVQGVYDPFPMGISPNTFGLEFRPTPLYLSVAGALYRTRGVFFRGWIALAIAATLVVLGWRRRRWSAAAVAASGLLYVAPYAVLSSGSDFRYVWWLIVSALLGVVLFVFEPPWAWPRPGPSALPGAALNAPPPRP